MPKEITIFDYELNEELDDLFEEIWLELEKDQ